MMYQDKFVVVLKNKGKILREQGDIVRLPFGSEYTVLLKNLSTKRAVAKIEIDGREVTGGGLVVDANSTVELERFIDNDDLQKGYRFKFIQKTKDVQEFRGDKVDDGFIRVEWQYEKEHPVITWARSDAWLTGRSSKSFGIGGSTRGIHASGGDNCYMMSAAPIACAASPTAFTCSVEEASNELNESPLKDEGITVEGSDSNQRFRTVSVGAMESELHVIILKLVGATEENKPIQKPVFVDTRKQCKTCGSKWPYNQQYCGKCSARLTPEKKVYRDSTHCW